MSASDAKKKALEEAAAKHHRVVHVEKVTVTYRPTPPSGPTPPGTRPARAKRRR